MDEGASFGSWLKQHCKELDLTQAGLAQCVGCSVATIKKIEAGTRRPSLQVAERLAHCLEVPAGERPAFLKFARAESPTAAGRARPPAAPPWRAFSTTPSSLPNNLPAALNSFIGREKQRDRVVHFLSRPGVRLLTLAGPPGIGKTRLALQAARALQDEAGASAGHPFADGLFFVPLAAITDSDLVIGAIARTLGVSEMAHRTLAESLVAYLRTRHMLLVLDNFEQVVAAGPRLAELLEAAPHLKILVTSRAVLHLYGEHELRLPPLTVPARGAALPIERLLAFESVALFNERAQAVRPGFSLTEQGAEVVAEIARRLDGLPLALELAAARTRWLSPRAILDWLEQEEGRLRLLTEGARNLAPRQQTLKNAIAWSYNLLTADEQAVFRRVAVFVGGFVPDAARQVCADDSAVAAILGALVDQSLLRAAGGPDDPVEAGPRFAMLETIREYGLKVLAESGEASATRRAHALYYQALAEQSEEALRGPDQAAWLVRLEHEHDNLRAALGWAQAQGEVEIGLRLAAALYRFWERRGHWTEGRRWFAALLPLAGRAVPAALRAKALYEAGWLAWRQDDYTPARQLFQDSLILARRAGDKREIIPSLMGLGNIAIDSGAYRSARRYHREVLTISRQLDDHWLTSAALTSLGQVARFEGAYSEALALHEESLRLRTALGDKRGMAITLNNLGEIARCQGRYGQARALHEEGQVLAQEMGDRLGIALSLRALGDACLAQRDLEKAQHSYQESLALQRELGNKWGIMGCLEGLGRVWLAKLARRQVPADAAARSAAVLFAAAQALRAAIGARLPAAELAATQQDLAQARAHLDEMAWEALWDFGQSLSWEQAADLALHE